MFLQPDFDCFCLAIWQHINGLMALHIDQDAAEFTPTPQGKVVYTYLQYLLDWLFRQGHNAPNDSFPRGFYPCLIRDPYTQHPPCGKPDDLNKLKQPCRDTSPRCNKR